MNMMISYDTERPADWPANNRELLLENVLNSVENFIKQPDYNSKEILVSLTTNYDLNQTSSSGSYRNTDYEIAIINTLWFKATKINLNSIKTLLYEIITDSARNQIIASRMISTKNIIIDSYKNLYEPLKLYYLAYLKYKTEGKSFADQLIEFVNSYLENDFSLLNCLTHSYVILLNDISHFRSLKRNRLWAFNREELFKLFQLESKLIKLNNDSAIKSDAKDFLMQTISNYILKSRNDYNEDYICKYVPSKVAEMSLENHQIWIKKVKYLNDEREQKIVPEILKKSDWLEFNWANGINLTPEKNYYVSSFCKNYSDDDMKKNYGSCIYGYKNDRICDLISPLCKYQNQEKEGVIFSQVITFDVLYDIDKAKEEINFLCKIIDLFDLDDTEKKEFLEKIMQYWILSVKDKKWEHEDERRYVIFLNNNYNYLELDKSDDCYLKIKTSLFSYPDFILGENPHREILQKKAEQKANVISAKDYMFCRYCLSVDYDLITGTNEKCPICNSTEYIHFTLRNNKTNGFQNKNSQ